MKTIGLASLTARVVALLVLTFLTTTNPARALDNSQISQIEDAVVKHICSDPSWVACWGEQPSSCTTVIRSVAHRCLQEYLSTVQTGMDPSKAQDIGVKIIGCLNKDFLESHPMGKKNSPECAEVPQHLR
jgi:hypothetical protein